MQNILIYLFHRMKKISLKEKKLSLKNKKFPFKENFPARWGGLIPYDLSLYLPRNYWPDV